MQWNFVHAFNIHFSSVIITLIFWGLTHDSNVIQLSVHVELNLKRTHQTVWASLHQPSLKKETFPPSPVMSWTSPTSPWQPAHHAPLKSRIESNAVNTSWRTLISKQYNEMQILGYNKIIYSVLYILSKVECFKSSVVLLESHLGSVQLLWKPQLFPNMKEHQDYSHTAPPCLLLEKYIFEYTFMQTHTFWINPVLATSGITHHTWLQGQMWFVWGISHVTYYSFHNFIGRGHLKKKKKNSKPSISKDLTLLFIVGLDSLLIS